MGAVKLLALKCSENMKGLIIVVLIAFGLCNFALVTHGQPVPDQDDDYDYVSEKNDSDDDVPDQDDDDDEDDVPDQDDGVSETGITVGIPNPCIKGCRLKSIRQQYCVKRAFPRIKC